MYGNADDFRKRRADFSPRAGGKQTSPAKPRPEHDDYAIQTLANGWSLEFLENDILLITIDRDSALMLLPAIPGPVTFAVRGRVILWPLIHARCLVSGAPVSRERALELGGVEVYSPTSHALQELAVGADLQSGTDLSLDSEVLTARIRECVDVCADNLAEGLRAVLDTVTTRIAAALLFRRCASPACDVVCSVSRFEPLFLLPGRSCVSKLGFELQPAREQSWCLNFTPLQTAAQRAVELCREKPNAIIVVIGGKDSGKSTTVRFLLNLLLLDSHRPFRRVGLLDCDVGQTEMTPAEFLALSLIDRPLFGPPFTHTDRKPLRQCFLGQLSPNDDPNLYINAIEFLFEKWQAERRDCPLIVNTMGWPRDLGRMLLVDIVRILRPHLLVQLQSANSRDNYSHTMTTDVIATDRGWLSGVAQLDLNFDTLVAQIPKMHTPSKFPRALSPYEHREATLLGHLSGFLVNQPQVRVPLEPSEQSNFLGGRTLLACLTAVPPRRVPWSQLAIHAMNADRALPSSVILMAVNGALVSLCHLPPDLWSNLAIPEEGADLPRVLRRKPRCEALGIGLVRAIDPVAKELLIVTGLPLEDLSTVNCVLRGGMDLPSSLGQEKQNGEVPYFEKTPNSGIGCTGIRKERAHLAVRKKPL